MTFGHHMLAYVEMLAREPLALADARKRMNENPLGRRRWPVRAFPSTGT